MLYYVVTLIVFSSILVNPLCYYVQYMHQGTTLFLAIPCFFDSKYRAHCTNNLYYLKSRKKETLM